MAETIQKIYTDSLCPSGSFNTKNIGKYEMEQHLEKTLWPAYKGDSDRAHIMSIVLMINEKFRERLPSIWESLTSNPAHFPALFSNVCQMILKEQSIKTKTAMLIFLNHCFNSVEIEMVRQEIQKYVSMTLWVSLSPQRLEHELDSVPKLRKLWKKIQKSDGSKTEEQLKNLTFERTFMKELILDYFRILSGIQESAKKSKNLFKDSVSYCERFLEFLIDLEALLPTRRFFNSLLDDLHVVTLSRLSVLVQSKAHLEGKLFSQLLENLLFYARFEIDGVTGNALDDKKIEEIHLKKITKLQETVFRMFPDDENVRPLYLDGISGVETREKLIFLLGTLPAEDLIKLTCALDLGFISGDDLKAIFKLFPAIEDKRFLLEILVYRYEKLPSQLKIINKMPLYPNEETIWDENLVPSDVYFGDSVLPLPKLNIQFLTLHDYLLRNFHLFRLESAYEIRQDIEQSVGHLNPWKSESGETMFGGWARMALPVDSFVINSIGKPEIGSHAPRNVKADVIVNLNVRKYIKQEWQSLRKHDVCFLVTVKPQMPPNSTINWKESIVKQCGIVTVRGCEVEGILDPAGKIIDEFNLEYGPHGTQKLIYNTDYRTFRVSLDPNQYYIDSQGEVRKAEMADKYGNSGAGNDEEEVEDVYGGFNVLIRRKAKANNFKAVLETIRDLMNTKFVVPEWIHDVILGYGDPSSANYRNLQVNSTIGYDKEIDFYDTFTDFEHVKEAFPEAKNVTLEGQNPPYKVQFQGDQLVAKSVGLPNYGPYKDLGARMNKVRFTGTQVEAIRSGLNHGLTMVVGPPGTGKTDLAVQIINLIYHNHPDQRTLIVTHSNQALNAIFEKIMALNIDQRHLLRLGHGEEALGTQEDFSRYGRVDYVLRKRLELLQIVGNLAQSLGHSSDVSHTCETASYFYLYKVVATWESFLESIRKSPENPEIVADKFPFRGFFGEISESMFKKESFQQDFHVAQGCFRYIKDIFEQLEEFKPFEMLRSGHDRSNYLMLREAKIIAMTCTHAALRRKELSALGFQYDNILMEESAQILEIETFIPLLLQNSDFGHNRLKRWIMIGDHLQLPPVIQNMSFQKYCNMEQSLFSRFVRLGVPTIYLDRQGRSRDSLAKLWAWRYKDLGSLPHVEGQREFQQPNPGFEFDYQLINVPDFDGTGESEPVAHFYQNLAEAEFCVATYMYMRLIGYPREKITILTTYNGQKHLIRDIVQQRCANNPFIGLPARISTVDKFQGQQNDYILLSLVRTKAYGHIRDIRRLTVAMSRARLGLYVFARAGLFAGCFELQKTFQMLMERPTKLSLIPGEEYSKLTATEEGIVRTGNEEKVAVEDMPAMHDFVFDFYDKRTAWLQSNRPEEFAKIVDGDKEEEKDEKDDGKDGEGDGEEEEEPEMGGKVEEMEPEVYENGNEEMEELPFVALDGNDDGVTDDFRAEEAGQQEEEEEIEDMPELDD